VDARERYVPEIVIGFVAPSGTDFDRVLELVSERLRHYAYQSVRVRLSVLLSTRAEDAGRLTATDAKDYAKRTKALQGEGDRFRASVGANHALALAAVNEIVLARRKLNEAAGVADAEKSPVEQVAYLVWSFKTPEELTTLRAIYRSRFFAISVHTPRNERVDRLALRIAESRKRIGNPSGADRADAEEIVANDEHEDRNGGAEFGQNVRDAYPLADFFINADDPASVDRVVDIIFGHPFLTPTRDEFAMFVANAAAIKSAELGRQVGAAIADDQGDILATGVNEVPAAGGGQYADDRKPDHREFTRGVDSSDELRDLLAGDIEQRLREADVLKEPDTSTEAIQGALRSTHIRFLTEFGRALHAEASAFMDAARRGVAVSGATIYVTTFPCHQCTRQVIASGIKRLVYIYPYPKSLAARFHGDAIYIDEDGPSTKVPFQPFRGVAPRRYLDAFTMTKRKNADGKAVAADDTLRSPRLFPGDEEGIWEAGNYILMERNALQIAGDIFKTPAA
jgi:deoxycytidylate deaminase